MTSKNRRADPDTDSDPFGEQLPLLAHRPLRLLGGRFHFNSNSRELLRLVDAAYDGLPGHRLSASAPDLRITLLQTASRKGREPPRDPYSPERSEPPPVPMLSGAGLLAGATDLSNFVVLSPRERSALVTVSPQMPRFPYHIRYELIEFAVFTLAARVQNLVSLHAACVGRKGQGVLLMGASGSGKSTVTLLSLLQGFDILSEDSVFIVPDTMLATGIANFLHVRSDSLRWVERARDVAAIRRSPVIQRRSGVRKFEVDLRRAAYCLAPSPLRTRAVVFLSAQRAGRRAVLSPISKSSLIGRLNAAQAYAANQPEWSAFCRNVSRLGAFELRRGSHPQQTVDALGELLASH